MVDEWRGSGALQVCEDPFEVHIRNGSSPGRCLMVSPAAWLAFLAAIRDDALEVWTALET